MPSARRKLTISLSTRPPRFEPVGRALRNRTRQTLFRDEVRPKPRRSCRRFPGARSPLPDGLHEAGPDPSLADTHARPAPA